MMDNILIDSNSFVSISSRGISMYSFSDQGYSNVTMNCNTISSNDIGLNIGDGGGSWTNVMVNNNSFLGNTTSAITMANVLNNTLVIDVTNNYYSAADGPSNASNPEGTGDVVDGAGSVGEI